MGACSCRGGAYYCPSGPWDKTKTGEGLVTVTEGSTVVFYQSAPEWTGLEFESPADAIECTPPVAQ
jgi:hypothetical protein